MATQTLTFNDMVEETFSVLYRHVERPRQTTVGSQELADSDARTITFSDPDLVNVTDLVETEAGEQLLIVEKSDTDVFTVDRAYNDTENGGRVFTGSKIQINPQWGRTEVDRWVRRFFSTAGNVYLPSLKTDILFRETGDRIVVLPADVMEVKSVRAQGTDGAIVGLAGWSHERDLPTTIYPTGQGLTTPVTIDDDDELWVTYTSPYDTSGDDVDVQVGFEDLAVLWAAAYAVGRREVSRMDLDSIQEWNQQTAIRNGQNLRLMRELWGEFYRRTDEARKVHYVPKHRPYRAMPKIR